MSRLASAAFGLAFGILTVSEAAAEVTSASVRDLLLRAGVTSRIVNDTADMDYRIAKLAAGGIEGITPEVAERLFTLLYSLVDGKILIDLSVSTLAERLSEEKLDEVDAFYASPLGRRVVDLEGAAPATEAIERIHGDDGKPDAPLEGDPVRKMLLGWLDDALHMSERAASFIATVKVGSDLGLALAQQ